MIEAISQLPGEVSTVILLVLLITAFIIAFKVMKMVFQTIMVSVISGVFYIALSFLLFDTTPTLNNILLFAFLGSTFYMVYSFLMSAYSVGAKLVSIPYHGIVLAMKPFFWVYSEIKKNWRTKKLRKKLESGKQDFSPDNKKEKSTKEVVLDKVKGKKDEDN